MSANNQIDDEHVIMRNNNHYASRIDIVKCQQDIATPGALRNEERVLTINFYAKPSNYLTAIVCVLIA